MNVRFWQGSGFMTFLLRRLVAGALVLLILSMLLFFAVRALPGDPATSMLGTRATPELVEQINKDFGLNEPLPLQYWTWLTRALRGDLGYSLATASTTGELSGRPVSSIVLSSLGVTLPLSLLSILLATVVGVAIGAVAGVRKGLSSRAVFATVSTAGISTPDFFVAFVLILIFSAYLKVLPSVGYVSLASNPLEALRALALPVLTLGIINAAPIARITKASIEESLASRYTFFARAKGTPELVVVLKYALRNALIPVVTVIGLQLGYVLGGVVVVETVFALPGTGRSLLLAVTRRDYPTLQALILTFALGFILLNIIVDALYRVLDPRIGRGG